MQTREVVVGIIGAGHIAGVHARHLARIPGARLAAVADAHPERAARLAEEYGASACPDNQSLLAEGEIEAVLVCVPTESHREVTERTLAAGKHVLCEKPLALTVTDCDALIAAARQADRLLTVGQVVRFFPEYENARRLIQDGVVGNPAAVRLRRNVAGKADTADWYADPERGGGILFDLLVHEFDWLLWCFGPIARVYAHSLTGRLAEKTSPVDYALITLRHTSGVIAHVEGQWGDPNGYSVAFEIAGDAGLITHDSRRASTLNRTLREGITGALSSPLFPQEDPYYRQLAAFLESVRSGTPLAVTAEDGRAAVRVAGAAALSAATGRVVELDGMKPGEGSREGSSHG